MKTECFFKNDEDQTMRPNLPNYARGGVSKHKVPFQLTNFTLPEEHSDLCFNKPSH